MRLKPFDIVLRDGSSVQIREVQPEDLPLLKIGFSHLSDRSRFFRFLSAHPKLTPDDITRFTQSNDRDHVAIGAVADLPDGPTPVGLARFIRLLDRDGVAEFAITVVDDFQGQGVGTTLMGVLCEFAQRHGISDLVGLVHRDNVAMRGLFEQMGGAASNLGAQEVEVTLALPADPAQYPDNSVGQRIRTAYELAEFSGDEPARRSVS